MPQTSSARIERAAPLLSLAMIVRDGGEDLVRCLTSARAWVDEIVVGDTGSGDASAAAVRALGGRAYALPWHDDFAAARNAVLQRCTGRWILALDADEALAPGDAARLRVWTAARATTGEIAGAVVTTRNYLRHAGSHRGWRPLPSPDPHAWPAGAPATGFVPSAKVRIFPNRPEIRYRGCVHETVEGALIDAGGRSQAIDAVVHHWGWLSPREDRTATYRRLAARKTAAQPGDAGAWAELADAHLAAGDRAAALRAAGRACRLAPDQPRHRLTVGLILLQMGRLAAADRHLAAVAAVPRPEEALLAECWHARAKIALHEDRFPAAARLIAAALRRAPYDGHAWNTAGVLQGRMGRTNAAFRAFTRARALLPDHPEPLANLAAIAEARRVGGGSAI